jgi:hypothetical protein
MSEQEAQLTLDEGAGSLSTMVKREKKAQQQVDEGAGS